MSLRAVSSVFFVALSTALTVVACSSKEEPKTEPSPTEPVDSGVDAGPSAKEGCETLAKARCDRLERCSPHQLRGTHGSIETCEAREKLACAAYEQPGTAIEGSALIACAGELPNVSCDDFLRGTLPAQCAAPGNLERNASCAADSQCKSGACGTHGKACGTCTLVSRAGEECTKSNCGSGLACLSGSCVKLGKAGTSCDSARLPCLTGLVCVKSKCSEPIRNEETACDPDASACDVVGGLYCDRESLTCKPVTLAAVGGECGFIQRVFITCEGGATCSGGVCVAPKKDGESCGSDSQCAAPARCIEGKCALRGASACN